MYQQALKLNAEMDNMGKNACNDAADPNAALSVSITDSDFVQF